VVIILPLIYFFAALATEVGRLFQNVGNFFDYDQVASYLKRILPVSVQGQIPAIMYQAVNLISAVVQKLSSSLLTFFSNVVSASLGFLVVLFSLYYLLKDGQKVKRELLRLSPLSDENDQRIFLNVTTTVRAVIVGFLFIGLLKGLLAGAAYWVSGVPAPLFWGAMTGLANFVPLVGSGLVMIPTVIYLALKGAWGAAIGLALFSTFVIGLVDNFIQPRFIGERTKIHPLLVLLALLGGLEFFGFTGIILGPLALAVTMALVSIYKSDYSMRDEEKAVGKDKEPPV
jgi:predicted PurR-regulated permease PerM